MPFFCESGSLFQKRAPRLFRSWVLSRVSGALLSGLAERVQRSRPARPRAGCSAPGQIGCNRHPAKSLDRPKKRREAARAAPQRAKRSSAGRASSFMCRACMLVSCPLACACLCVFRCGSAHQLTIPARSCPCSICWRDPSGESRS